MGVPITMAVFCLDFSDMATTRGFAKNDTSFAMRFGGMGGVVDFTCKPSGREAAVSVTSGMHYEPNLQRSCMSEMR